MLNCAHSARERNHQRARCAFMRHDRQLEFRCALATALPKVLLFTPLIMLLIRYTHTDIVWTYNGHTKGHTTDI